MPGIMFWRPQKVGSSTILSILVSYGFRYNAIPRRKGRITQNVFLIFDFITHLSLFSNSGYEQFLQENVLLSFG